MKPQWRQAVCGEAFMWGFFLTMVGFTTTLQDRVAEMFAGVTLVLWFFDRAARRTAAHQFVRR